MRKSDLSKLTVASQTKAGKELAEILSYAVMHGPATVVITSADGTIEYVNRKFSSLTGYAPSEAIGQKASLLKSGLMTPSVYRTLWRHLNKGEAWTGEFHNRKKSGALYWERASIAPIRDAAGTLLHYLKIAEDITDRKRLEDDLRASFEALKTREAQVQATCRELAATTRALEKSRLKLQRLSQEDALTGLLNRRGFDMELQRIKALAERQGHSIGFLIIDIDHFKQVNDRHGHAVGDRILKACAKLFRARLRPSDLICRYGGDEIVVALPSANSQSTCQTAQRLLEAVRKHAFSKGRAALSITVSVGAACGVPAPGQPFDEVIRRADRALYRVKRSGRNGVALGTDSDATATEHEAAAPSGRGAGEGTIGAFTSALSALLAARDPATAAHCRRVARIASALAGALKLPSEQAAQVAQSALLHDIGKIAVPDAVLLKPGALTAKERKAVQEHARIGHELLRFSPGLKALADAVLAHHERLDGSGYPGGLKGPHIGMAARILAVADTYDTIRAGRPYAKSRSAAEALSELRRCQGTQFDPAVVDALARCQSTLEAALSQDDSTLKLLTAAGRSSSAGRRGTSRP
jgi:diguanylate cyclase (GGDEF)-like protein/PAS domain S-box-containing protein/putative nucleotidyltransferase with HDIG domain